MSNQKGIVSIITVVVVSVVMVLVTTATSSQMVGELKQSSDNESSVKAYYGAYSGLEETYAMISAVNASVGSLAALQRDCSGSASVQPFFPDRSNSQGDAGHTCRVIKVVSTEAKGSVDVDKVTQFNLTFPSGAPASKRVNSVELQWDQKGGGTPPPEVIFTVVSWPKDEGPAPTDIRSVILRPGVGSSSYDFNFRTSSAASIITPVNCVGVPPARRCRVRLFFLLPAPSSNYQTIIRLRPITYGMDYTLKAWDEGDNPLKIVLPEIEADMTSRSGDSFRRLASSVPVRSKPLSVLDNVVFGNNSICKDFIILGDTPQLGGSGSFEIIRDGGATGCEIDNSSQR